MISTLKKMVVVWGFILSFTLAVFSGLVQAQEYSEDQLHIFNEITKGVKSFGKEGWRFTAIAPLKDGIVPLFWGDHKAYTGDIRWPQNSYPPVAIACEYQKGRFVALGHDGLLIDPSANDNLTENILNWLGNNYINKEVVIYTNISNWFNKANLTTKAKEFLATRGVEIIELGSRVTDDDLKKCDLFIIDRPSRIIDQNEVGSIVSYVEQGGSLLITGMGYFWEEQNKPYELFALNKLGEHLGFEYSRTSIDKTALNDKKGPRRYSFISFQPLNSRRPIEVKHYSIKEQSNSVITHNIAVNFRTF